MRNVKGNDVLNGKRLSRIDKEKDLGVTLNENLILRLAQLQEKPITC